MAPSFTASASRRAHVPSRVASKMRNVMGKGLRQRLEQFKVVDEVLLRVVGLEALFAC